MATIAKPLFRPFLLMEGGPLYNLQKRVGLARPEMVKRRAIAAALLTFFPLLFLSILQHRGVAHVDVPFLRDFSTYSRFLFAVPLLLLAENILGPRIATAASYFVDAGIVLEKDYASFNGFIERGLRARDSTLVEIVLAILAYILAFVGLRSTEIHVSTWYLTRSGAGISFTWAGWWLILFCIPLFQFLVYRWVWRLFLWFQFLYRVRHLDLQLFPTHPDEAGGLGFVGDTQRFFGIILFALSVGTVGVLADDILYNKVPLSHFYAAIATYVVVAVLILVAPLCLFASLLLRTKRVGLHQYGALATAYTGAFHHKWITHRTPAEEPLLGTRDLRSLADLGNSFELIEKMKPLPIDLLTLLHLVAACILPVTPLLLTVMPLGDLIHLVLKIFM